MPTVSRRLFGRIVIFGSDAGVIDAGVIDGGPRDAGPLDTGPRDTGGATADLPTAVDVRVADGGALDAATDRPATTDVTAPDTGSPATDVFVSADVPFTGEDAPLEPGDLGVVLPADAPATDAGRTDVGVRDAALVDAALADVPTADAAIAADAGTAPDDGGGLCSVHAVGAGSSRGSAGAAALAFALVSLGRRRPRCSRAPQPRG